MPAAHSTHAAEAKAKLLEICKDDKSKIQDTLKDMQSQEWVKMGIEPEFGFKQISNLAEGGLEKQQELTPALLQAARVEEMLMLIALCGSEEKYNAFELKIRRLYEQAMMEFQRDYVALQQQPEKLTPLIQGIVEKYSGLVSGMDSLSEIQRLERRLNFTDEEIVLVAKGEQILSIQQQQAQAMRAQRG